MPPKENPERACEECIHFFACSRQCGEQMAQRSAIGCECYETVKSIAAARLIERLTAENAKAEAERDAALADLADARSCKTCKYACDTRDCSSCKSKTCKCRECHLDKIAREWLRSDDDWNSLTTIQCSICGEEWCFETDDDVSLLNYKYCPNCGAKMDGGFDDAVD